MRTRTIRRWVSALAIVASGIGVAASGAAAAFPSTITHQGRIYNSSNLPLNGTLAVQFAIYDAANAVTPIWSEVHTIAFDDGYYAVDLGSIVPFNTTPGAQTFDGSVRWLGITV